MPITGTAPNKTYTRTDGTRTGTNTWAQADAAGVDILSADHDTHDEDVATALRTMWMRDGGNQPTADIPMGGYKITGLGDATAATDGLNRQFGDARYSLRTEAEGTIASAATTDIGAETEYRLNITGTATITSLGTTANSRKLLRFSGALTLTHNATTLILPGGANITTAAGDVAEFASDGSGNWRCVNYERADGTALVATSIDLSSVAEDILPDADGTRDLGSASKAWAELHSDKTFTPLFRSPSESADRSITGVAAAWANLNGTGTIALRDSSGISSAVDNGTGDYTFNLSSSMADANYQFGVGAYWLNGSYEVTTMRNSDRVCTASAISVSTRNIGFGARDTDFAEFSAHGDLA